MSNRYAIIADPDRIFGRALRVQLDALGYVGFVAADANQVLAHVRQFVPGLVILDVRLPGLGAYQACLQIRRMPGCSALPILLMAASDQPRIVAAAHRAGASALLTKPFSMNDLMQQLDTVGQAQRRPASTAVPWEVGLAESPAPRPAVPPSAASRTVSGPAAALELGSQILGVIRRRESGPR